MPNPAGWGDNNREARKDFDDYPTPAPFVEELLKRESFRGEVWEPAAGAGHMVVALRAGGLTVRATDLRRGERLDFLSEHNQRSLNIITNPPYRHVLGFTHQALQSADRKVALLVKTTFLEGVTRYRQLFEPYPPIRVYIGTRRMTPQGKGGGGAFAHCWVVWEVGYRGETTLDWFTPMGDIHIPEGEPDA